MTADKNIYLETFTQVHSFGTWIESAIDDCCLCGNTIERLKNNKIDADILTFSRTSPMKLKDACPKTPVVRQKVKKRGHNIETYSIEDALGKYYDLAVEALGSCDASISLSDRIHRHN